MDKASSLFQHQAQKAAPPTLSTFSRARVRALRAYIHYNPTFFAFTAFTTHRKTPRNSLIRLYDFAFHLYPSLFSFTFAFTPIPLIFNPSPPSVKE